MATWTNPAKDATVWTDSSLDASVWTDASKSPPLATPGMYYGFGAFTYSGGQALSGSSPWINLTED